MFQFDYKILFRLPYDATDVAERIFYVVATLYKPDEMRTAFRAMVPNAEQVKVLVTNRVKLCSQSIT